LQASGALGVEILKHHGRCFDAGRLLIDIPISCCHSFEHGGVCSKADSYDALLEFISMQLANKPDSYFLLYNQYAHFGDPIVERYLYPVFMK